MFLFQFNLEDLRGLGPFDWNETWTLESIFVSWNAFDAFNLDKKIKPNIFKEILGMYRMYSFIQVTYIYNT